MSRIPRFYQAATALMVGHGLEKANPTSQDTYLSQHLAQTYREVVSRQPVLRGAAEMLGLPCVPSAEDVSAWLVPGTPLMGVAVRDTHPERARALADVVARLIILETPDEIAGTSFLPAGKPSHRATYRERGQSDSYPKCLTPTLSRIWLTSPLECDVM